MSGQPAKITGRAPATSATARRFLSPACWVANRFSTRCAFPMMPITGRFMVRLSCPRAQILERVFQPRKRFLEDRAGRREIEAQPGLAARPELLAGARKD